MRAILIHPSHRAGVVSEFEFVGTGSPSLASILSREGARSVESVAHLVIDFRDSLWYDEHALYSPRSEAFRYDGSPICGPALILGMARSGEFASPKATLEDVRRKVEWLP